MWSKYYRGQSLAAEHMNVSAAGKGKMRKSELEALVVSGAREEEDEGGSILSRMYGAERLLTRSLPQGIRTNPDHRVWPYSPPCLFAQPKRDNFALVCCSWIWYKYYL